MTNEQKFKDFITETNARALEKGWVIWMLDTIEQANLDGREISPHWLRAKGRYAGDDEPEMVFEWT